MRFSVLRWLSAIAMLALTAQFASGQFTVREINLEGQEIHGAYQHYYYATSEVDQQWLDDSGFVFIEDVEDFKEELDYINVGGNNGWFDDSNGNPLLNAAFVLGDDYIVDARAEVEIPAGTWTIAFNTDDGGQMTLPGAGFFGNYGVSDLYGKNSPNQFWFQGNRGHGSTGASFTVPDGETLTTLLHSTFHERGGGDSFEITIRPGGPGNSAPRPGEADWVLLEDGAHGWSVSPTDDLPARGGDGLPLVGGAGGGTTISPASGSFALGNHVPAAAAIINTTGDGAEAQAGLYQKWYAGANPGTLQGQLQRIASGDPAVEGQDGQTWWAGNSPTAEIRGYPDFVDGVGDWTVDGNNEEYLAWLSGEINLPEGTTAFRLGVDDYKYLAIDSGGNGTAGDEPGEVLMDNNTWLNNTALRGNGSLPNTVAVESTGGWTAIELIMAEGGGGDANILFWSEGNDDFPFAAPFSDDSGFAPEEYAVPEDALRGVTRGAVEGVALKAGFAGATLDLEVSSRFRDSDKIVLSDPAFDTEINLAGATVNVSALDGEELTAGDQFVLFNADSIVGLGEATFNLAGGNDLWDMSGLMAGTTNRITFTGGGGGSQPLAGDADRDGDVDFDDFVALSNSFGQPAVPPGSGADFDMDGTIDFDDFVALSNNFGATAAAAVPEPSSLALLSLAGLLAGLVRRRRS